MKTIAKKSKARVWRSLSEVTLAVLKPVVRVLKSGAIGASLRSSQRFLALWIAAQNPAPERSPRVPKEMLRAFCRELRLYDSAVFNYYMADERPIKHTGRGEKGPKTQPWFREVEGGWDLLPVGELALSGLVKIRLIRAEGT